MSQQVFHTQHSTEQHMHIAQDGLILLCEIGSTMHGVSDPSTGDDIDEMGICIESANSVIGLSPFEQYEYRTQPVNHRSGEGDIDRTVYSLRKWARLAAQGNPTVLMPLFADDELHVRYIDPVYGVALRLNAPMFLSKEAGHKFLGYLDGQRKRYLDPNRVDSTHASRPELVERFGWDTKTGYHALRLAIQGTELMVQGSITLPMDPANQQFLLGVRGGHCTKEWVTRELDEAYIPTLKDAIERSTLPDQPDYEAINRWLTKVHLQFWEERS